MSDFRMVPLPFSKLENLIPLLHERFEELAEKHRLVSKDKLHDSLKEGYATGAMDCYVNDVENPTHMLVVMRVMEFWDNPPTLYVQAVYISRKCRGDKEALKSIVDAIETYAKFYGIRVIVTGAHCNDEGEPISLVWEKSGFKRAQITYTKTI